MRHVPGWTLGSALAAPVLLIGGWTIAGAVQPGGYDPVADTISALAGRGAHDRWLMTGAFIGLGLCYLVTALGLRVAARPGRIVLAAGGAATLLVAALPQPVRGSSAAHMVAAGVAFAALAVWAALAGRRGPRAPWAFRPGVSVAATVVLLGAVAWFVWHLHAGVRVGLTERITAGAQVLWPLVAVVSARRWTRRRFHLSR